MKFLTTKLCAFGALLAFAAVTAVQAAVPGISGPNFNLTASADYISQPDGARIYSWGYGCSTAVFLPVPAVGSQGPGASCNGMQMPGPTLIVTEGATVSVTLVNALPPAAGNTSIVFPGFTVTATGGVGGRLVQEAAIGTPVTYTFVAGKPGTYAYYSGTQPELQIEMGLFGALVVLPNSASAAAAKCAKPAGPYSLAASAYGHPGSCYDREYLFQFSEMDSRVHEQARLQAEACTSAPCPQIAVANEPFRPNYYLINGRSMPDIQDTPYSAAYVHQPYNGNPHMHPGEMVLMRVVGQGRWQHPFHFHGNHARVIARDGNIILSQTDATQLAGPLLFTIPTVSGQSVDAIFTWTGQGLNWDVYGIAEAHTCNGKPLPATPGDTAAQSAGFDPVTKEYCPDHGKPIPVTPPDPQIVINGQWYGGTPYLGLQSANPTPQAPGTLNQNPEAGYAYMWHSHNEREITTNDVFPGGMLMMLLIDPMSWTIDETL